MTARAQIDPMLTPEELAEHWRVTKGYIHQLIREEGLPSVKLGPAAQSPRRIRLSEAEAWLQTRQPEVSNG